jgi:APA family basic amino acid/polyamine antiporter
LPSECCWGCCSSLQEPAASISSTEDTASDAPRVPHVNDRPFSYRALFAVVYTASVSSVYFALGVVAYHANGLTPFVFLAGGIFFQLSAMTYAEGAALHSERGGSAVLGRYAFNELVSFVAGWAIVLDYTILLAVAALTAPAYLGAFWAPLGRGAPQVLIALGVIAFVALDNLTGVKVRPLRRRIAITGADLVLQILVIVLGLVLVLHPHRLSETIHLGTAPTWSNLAFAFPIGVVAFTGLEAAASIAGEVNANIAQLRRLVVPGSLVIVLIYVGIAFVGISALPVHNGISDLGTTHLHAPVLGIVESYKPAWVADVLKYAVAIGGALGLTAAAGAAMLGVSRVGYSLATNRQIPSAIGRLSTRWGTPFVVIGAAALASAALVLPQDLDLLIGIYAFGALLAFAIGHVSVIVLRFREPDRPRAYRVPFSFPFRGAQVPIPTLVGAVLAGAGLIVVLIYHSGARWVGIGWLLGGLALYVIYRKTEQKPLLRRVTIPERALRHETLEPEFGSILVPIFGTPLDDDIVQTAGRLAGETRDDVVEEGAVIEAIWVVELPLSLPLDAPLPENQIQRARNALARAKVVGEEYEGVEVATAIVRARRAGAAIVGEAKRRGVEAIVLAAEEPSRVRGGALLGGVGPLENYVGDVTKYVINKAPCRVILTAPPADWRAEFEAKHDGGDPAGTSASASASASAPEAS